MANLDPINAGGIRTEFLTRGLELGERFGLTTVGLEMFGAAFAILEHERGIEDACSAIEAVIEATRQGNLPPITQP